MQIYIDYIQYLFLGIWQRSVAHSSSRECCQA